MVAMSGVWAPGLGFRCVMLLPGPWVLPLGMWFLLLWATTFGGWASIFSVIVKGLGFLGDVLVDASPFEVNVEVVIRIIITTKNMETGNMLLFCDTG